jgi:hypothetical protein
MAVPLIAVICENYFGYRMEEDIDDLADINAPGTHTHTHKHTHTQTHTHTHTHQSTHQRIYVHTPEFLYIYTHILNLTAN